MASTATITIYNYTNASLSTKVTEQNYLQGQGTSINNKTIAAGQNFIGAVTAETGHHGELTVDLLNATNQRIGTFTVKSIKDPQEGEKSLEVSWSAPYIVSAMGYRHTPDNSDIRRVVVVAAQPCVA